MNYKFILCAYFGVIGGLIAKLFGGWTEDLITLLIFMAVDFVSGLIVAGVFKKSSKTKSGSLSSKVGWKGLCKKLITLLLVVLAARLDVLMGASYIRSATIIGFIANETISIIENAGLMGIPFPKAIKNAIDVLKNKKDGDKQ